VIAGGYFRIKVSDRSIIIYAAGKTFYTGKYMAAWEKRDGEWVCIHDIANDDVK
jgi:hypothetical protein